MEFVTQKIFVRSTILGALSSIHAAQADGKTEDLWSLWEHYQFTGNRTFSQKIGKHGQWQECLAKEPFRISD